MKPFTLPDGREGLIVEVPSMAFGLDIQNYTTEVELIYMLNLEEIDPDDPELASDETLITKKLPTTGNWQILADTSTMSEEVAGKLVRRHWYRIDMHKNYEDSFKSCATTLESFDSLLRSLGLDPANRYIILIKG